MGIIKTFEALAAVVFLWVSVTAFVYGCIEQSTFWIAIAIYCKLSSYITAYELGWLKPGYLSCTKGNTDDRNRNEDSSTSVQ